MDTVWRMVSPCDMGVINKIIVPKVWTFSNTNAIASNKSVIILIASISTN